MTKRLEQLKTMFEQNAKDAFIIFALAKEYEKSGDKELALFYYEKLVSDAPDYVGTYYHFGKLYETMNLPEKALEIYEKGIEIAKSQKDNHALSELNLVRDELL
jgi:tetratricopeptide (TPR) repeat protein